MSIEKRIERLEQANQQPLDLTIVVQSVDRDESGKMVALGESRFTVGGGDSVPYADYEKPILLQSKNGI